MDREGETGIREIINSLLADRAGKECCSGAACTVFIPDWMMADGESIREGGSEPTS